MRSIILVSGQNAVGKTTTCNLLSEIAREKHIPYATKPISDLFFLLDEIMIDDHLNGGRGHYHEWCSHKRGGHSHLHNEPITPFTVTDNQLIDNMFAKFFNMLSSAATDRLCFAEWTGGMNTNPPDEPASEIDLSFSRIGKLLETGTFSSRWLDHVHAVIHPIADLNTRYALNRQQHSDLPEELDSGRVSPKKTITNLRIFGEDDFGHIRHIFEEKGIPVYYVDNTGDVLFFERIKKLAHQIFEDYLARKQQEHAETRYHSSHTIADDPLTCLYSR